MENKEKFYQKKWFAIILLIIFAPVGIILLWTNKHWGKTTRVILSVVFGILFLAAVIGQQGDDTTGGKTDNDVQQEEHQKTDDEKADKSNLDKDKDSVEGTDDVESTKNEDVDDDGSQEDAEDMTTEEIILQDGVADDVEFHGGELTIQYEPTSLWDENSLMRTAFKMFANLPLAFEDDEVESVLTLINTKMLDNKGNESVKSVVNYRYSRETFEDLNYDNFENMAVTQEWRILNQADGYFIHPGIRKNLKKKYTQNLN